MKHPQFLQGEQNQHGSNTVQGIVYYEDATTVPRSLHLPDTASKISLLKNLTEYTPIYKYYLFFLGVLFTSIHTFSKF